MYEYIKGSVAEVAPTYAVIEAGGVGYYLHISLETFSAIEHATETKLFVHYVVREDAQLLYGFSTKVERELFRLLISVSGVGGNTARMILSTYSPRELQGIISSGNAVLLKNVKGLGLKTAQKIIVDLSGKLMTLGVDAGGIPTAGWSTRRSRLWSCWDLPARRPKRSYGRWCARRLRLRSRRWCAWRSSGFDAFPAGGTDAIRVAAEILSGSKKPVSCSVTAFCRSEPATGTPKNRVSAFLARDLFYLCKVKFTNQRCNLWKSSLPDSCTFCSVSSSEPSSWFL